MLWELRRGRLGFRALQERCDAMSTSVLRQRLVELLDAGLVEQDDAPRSMLTKLGVELGVALRPLLRWSERWAAARRRV